MATATQSIVIGLFEDRPAAEKAVSALTREGFSREGISVVSRDARTGGDIPNIAPIESPGAFDASTGAAWGGLAGFIGGIVALAIPGIGPILAAGPIAAGIMGAGLGAAAGGLVGGLKEHGLPENDAAQVAEAVKRGRVMVAAHVPTDRAGDAAKLMDDNGAVDTEQANAGIPSAATSRPTTFKPLTPEAVEAARLKPGESLMERQEERSRRATIYPGVTGMGSGPND